jgi:hypothetical protein
VVIRGLRKSEVKVDLSGSSRLHVRQQQPRPLMEVEMKSAYWSERTEPLTCSGHVLEMAVFGGRKDLAPFG